MKLIDVTTDFSLDKKENLYVSATNIFLCIEDGDCRERKRERDREGKSIKTSMFNEKDEESLIARRNFDSTVVWIYPRCIFL